MPNVPQAICLPCKVVGKIKKNNVVVEVTNEGRPYFKVYADLYRCPECGADLISGWGLKPFVESHEASYHRANPDFVVRSN